MKLVKLDDVLATIIRVTSTYRSELVAHAASQLAYDLQDVHVFECRSEWHSAPPTVDQFKALPNATWIFRWSFSAEPLIIDLKVVGDRLGTIGLPNWWVQPAEPQKWKGIWRPYDRTTWDPLPWPIVE